MSYFQAFFVVQKHVYLNMMENKNVFITRVSKFLPNSPVNNEDLEKYLGYIYDKESRSKKIVLRNNGIKSRYLALNEKGCSTHTNYELTSEAIRGLLGEGFGLNDIDLLACGTTSPDQLLPSHASMVHGELGCAPVEVISPAGSCNSGMLALRYGFLSVLAGQSKNAVCSGSEKISSWISSRNYKREFSGISEPDKNPYIAFEKEFLRWMLSDGAAALLLQPTPRSCGISLKIEWLEIISFANRLKTCMCAGARLLDNGDLVPWRDLPQEELLNDSVFVLKQDIKALERHISTLGVGFVAELAKKHNLSSDDVDYFLPHISSEFFRKIIQRDAELAGFPMPDNKWFTNLHKFGNVGSASPFLMLEELFNSGRLRPGQKVMVLVPESARFSYAILLLTVVGS